MYHFCPCSIGHKKLGDLAECQRNNSNSGEQRTNCKQIILSSTELKNPLSSYSCRWIAAEYRQLNVLVREQKAVVPCRQHFLWYGKEEKLDTGISRLKILYVNTLIKCLSRNRVSAVEEQKHKGSTLGRWQRTRAAWGEDKMGPDQIGREWRLSSGPYLSDFNHQ